MVKFYVHISSILSCRVTNKAYHGLCLVTLYSYKWLGLQKIDHLSAKSHWFLLYLLYHNLITIDTTTIKSWSQLQNLMGFLLQFTEMRYFILNGRYLWKYNSVKFLLTWSIFAGSVTYVTGFAKNLYVAEWWIFPKLWQC